MLTVTMTGMKEVETWLTNVAEGLEKVPQAFSQRQDVKNGLRDFAVLSLQMFGIDRTGVAQENIRAESTPDGKGIMVYEDLNSATASTGGAGGSNAGQNAYILFFLTEYAPQTWKRLRKSGVFLGRDFFELWPDMMRTFAVEAFEEEIRKALR